MNVTFHETVFFFSSSLPHLQGEKHGVCKDEVVLPLHVSPYLFDVDGCQTKGKQEVVSKEVDPTQKIG